VAQLIQSFTDSCVSTPPGSTATPCLSHAANLTGAGDAGNNGFSRQHVDFLLDAVQLGQYLVKPRDKLRNGRVYRTWLNQGWKRLGWRDSYDGRRAVQC